jgi:hypothetical protein
VNEIVKTKESITTFNIDGTSPCIVTKKSHIETAMNLIDVIASRLGYRFIKSSLLEDLTTPRWSMRKTLQRVKGYGIMPNTVIDIGAAEGVWSKLALQSFSNISLPTCRTPCRKKRNIILFCSKQAIYLRSLCLGGGKQGGCI